MFLDTVILPGRTRSQTRSLEEITIANILPRRTRSQMRPRDTRSVRTVSVKHILPGRTRSQTREWNELFDRVKRQVDKEFVPLFLIDIKGLKQVLHTIHAEENEL